MSPELIAIIAAAVSIGGLVTVQIRAVRADLAAQVAGVRADLAAQVAGVRTDLAAVNASVQALDGRVRAVETSSPTCAASCRAPASGQSGSRNNRNSRQPTKGPPHERGGLGSTVRSLICCLDLDLISDHRFPLSAVRLNGTGA